MFSIKKEPFGSFEKYTFSDGKGNAMAIAPNCGANLLDLCFAGVPVLDGYQNSEDLTAFHWAKSAVLVPFPNRLRDGRYVLRGQNYELPLNHPASGNAIHGIGKSAPMQVVKIWATETEAGLTCRWHYDGSVSGYPFPFTFETTQILRGAEFEMSMLIRNRHTEPIPAGLGWHPYFILSENVGDTLLQIPDSQQIILEAGRMLPTGEKVAYPNFKTLTAIADTELDTGFELVNQKKGKAEVVLKSERGQLTYWQERGKGKWNFLQIFTPPHRKSIAVEPMTCAPDAFNSGDGLTMLEPRKTLNGKFGVRFGK